MTGTELLALVRYLIQERVENKHLDTEIQLILNVAFNKWTSKIIESNYNYYVKSTTFTITADTRTASLPADCTGKAYLLDDTNSNPILLQDFADFKATDTGNPRRACIIGPSTIYFHRKPGSDYTGTIYYHYQPTDIDVTGSTEIDFPKNHHPLLAYEAAIIARLRVNLPVDGLVRMRDELVMVLIEEMDSKRIDGGFDVQPRRGQEISTLDVT